MKTLSEKIYAWEGLGFNLLCGLYFLFLSPLLQQSSTESIREGRIYPWVAILLILISLLEVYAFPKKMKYVQVAVLKHQKKMPNGFMLWLGHTVLSIVLCFAAMSALGYDMGDADAMPWWMVLILPAIVIKELYFLVLMMGLGHEVQNTAKYQRPNKKEWILDVMLLAYACIAYTVGWQGLSTGMDMDKDILPLYVVNLLLTSIIFLIFYMPLRIPYYLEEIAQLKTTGDCVKFVASILLVLIAALTQL